ncbi:MAG TPA: amidohydrolase family protein, partial [Gammaproteobacteria bacterium]
MRTSHFFFLCLPLLTACAPEEAPPPAPVAQSDAAVFEGATLIVGDGSAALEGSVFVVENGRFTAVGPAGSVEVPAGAERIDLTGKTVIPGLIDAHLHLGYLDARDWTDSPSNFTRDNLVDQLQRLAHHGVVAALSMGLDYDVVYDVRAESLDGVARLLTSGAGIARPNASAGDPARREVPFGVNTAEEGRAAVRELVARDVDMIKIWVDDRGGTVAKLTSDLYGPIIDEARAQGAQVAAHIFHLADAKDLLRAGLHGFAHGVRDEFIDQEFIELIAQNPDLFLIPNLTERGPRSAPDLAFAAETLPAAAIEAMRAEASEWEADPDELFVTQAR